MSACLLDTHSWVWSFTDNPMLSPAARDYLSDCDTIYISPISVFEIGQKVRKGKWPAMASYLDGLPQRIEEQGASVPAFTPQIALLAATVDWMNSDPFDRFLAATAIAMQIPLISADGAFDKLVFHPGWKGRIW